MISDERIERAAKALFQICPIRWAPTWADAHEKTKLEFRKEALAVLTADAPEIVAAEIRGLEMAKEIAERRANRSDMRVKREEEAAQIADAILARIDELNAKPEPTGCK